MKKKDLRIKELLNENGGLTPKLMGFTNEVESLARRRNKVAREIDEQEKDAKKENEVLARMNLELKANRLLMLLLVACILGFAGALVLVQGLGQMLAPCSRLELH